jgi:hypothetical protein
MVTYNTPTQAVCPDEQTLESTTKQQQLHLLCLPTELRIHIWNLVLGGTTFEIECQVQIPWGCATTNTTIQANSLALLRTCRQVYFETRLLPFRLNSFKFKSEDAFRPWLRIFDAAQQGAIQNVHLVTWKARHMVESRGFAPRRLIDVFPIEKFEGLRRIHIEARFTSIIRDCDKWFCEGYELEDVDWAEEEDKLKHCWTIHNARLIVSFARVAV